MPTRSIALAVVVAVALALAPAPAVAATPWSHMHGDAANTGFVDILTAPATVALRKVTGIGNYAPGAGPVVAANGAVYLGNTQGELRAFTAGGIVTWTRTTPGRRIVASPVVGADGSIYVVGTSTARDHRGGQDFTRYDAALFRFARNGTPAWVASLPEGGGGTGTTSAAPNIWRSGTTEVIMIPALYRRSSTYELHVVAMSTAGGVMFDQKVTEWRVREVTGTTDWGDALCKIYPFCFDKMFGIKPTVLIPSGDKLERDVEPPMPSVGIFGSGAGNPVVVVADNYQFIVGFTFSPAEGFQELFRKHLTNDWISMSAPVLVDGHSAIRGNGGSQAWVLFGGPHPVNWTEVSLPLSGSTPTLTFDGRIVLVNRDRRLTVIGTTPTRSVLNTVSLPGESIAPAAASCSHVFVSTANTLVTLDAKAGAVVTQFDWTGGGLSSPAIGIGGRLYAVAGNALFVFPPPPPPPAPPRPRPERLPFSCVNPEGVAPAIERGVGPGPPPKLGTRPPRAEPGPSR